MTRKLRVLIGTLLLAVPVATVVRLTLCNPAWMIRMRYPMAMLHINRINSPDSYWWAEIGEKLGIPMTAPDRYLNVTIDHYPGDLSLDDLTEVCELRVSHTRVVDISAYFSRPAMLTCPVFEACDFSGLPDYQHKWLALYSTSPERPDAYPDTFWIPYESRHHPDLYGIPTEQK